MVTPGPPQRMLPQNDQHYVLIILRGFDLFGFGGHTVSPTSSTAETHRRRLGRAAPLGGLVVRPECKTDVGAAPEATVSAACP